MEGKKKRLLPQSLLFRFRPYRCNSGFGKELLFSLFYNGLCSDGRFFLEVGKTGYLELEGGMHVLSVQFAAFPLFGYQSGFCRRLYRMDAHHLAACMKPVPSADVQEPENFKSRG